MKKSFVLFADQKAIVNKLTDEQAGKIFKALYDYATDDNISNEIKENLALDIIFTAIQQSVDRNNEEWEKTKQHRSEAGKKHKGNQYTKNGTDTNKMEQMEQMEQNETNGTNGTVSVSDSVSVSVSVNKKEKSNKRESTPPTLEEVQAYIKDKRLNVNAQKFFDYYEATGWKDSKGNKVKSWKRQTSSVEWLPKRR